jgi:hypothetical protein
MTNLFQRIRERFMRRQTQDLSDCILIWYQTSKDVSDICGQALYDPSAMQGDIGVVLDRADRKLFQYRNDASDAQRAVKRYNRDLAVRVSSITKQVYELRNQTASFLIRSQGPSPFVAPPDADRQNEYYQRALNESGFKARQFKSELDKDIQSMWGELEQLIKLL